MAIEGVSTATASGLGSMNRLITAMGARGLRLALPADLRPLPNGPTAAGATEQAPHAQVVDRVDLTSASFAEEGPGDETASGSTAPAHTEPSRGLGDQAATPPAPATLLPAHPWSPHAAYAASAHVASGGRPPAAPGAPSTATGGSARSSTSAPGRPATARDRVSVDRDTAFGSMIPLSEEEQHELDRLIAGDAEIRRHEEAHLAAAGSLTVSGPHYEYVTGPDGKRYAVAGEVNIDSAPVSGDPEATITKMQQVRRAALAPAEPSNADRAVARKAMAQEQEARRELVSEGPETGSPAPMTRSEGAGAAGAPATDEPQPAGNPPSERDRAAEAPRGSSPVTLGRSADAPHAAAAAQPAGVDHGSAGRDRHEAIGMPSADRTSAAIGMYAPIRGARSAVSWSGGVSRGHLLDLAA